MADGGSFFPRLAPLLLRVVIGGTFLWAGLGKLIPEVEFRGQDAAIAANLGAPIKIPPKPAAPSNLTLPPPSQIPLGDQPAAPGTTAPSTSPPAANPPAPNPPASTPPADPSTPSPQNSSDSRTPARPIGPARPAIDVDPAQAPSLPVAAGLSRAPARQPQPGQPTAPTTTPPPTAAAPPPPLPPGGKFTAADFPAAIKLPRVYQLAVVLTKAAYPQKGNPVWPKQLSGNPWAIYAAYLVAVVEVLAGGAVLLGFFVKPASLVLASVILSAIWITQIGPAAMGVSPSVLGFLPSRTWYDPQLWTPLLWQTLIFVTCLTLAMIGPGHLSADAALSAIGASEKGSDKAEK